MKIHSLVLSLAMSLAAMSSAHAQRMEQKLQPVPGATVVNKTLYLFGQATRGCVNTATTAYRLGREVYVFLADCDSKPAVYIGSRNEITRITDTTDISQVNSAYLGDNGYIVLNVTGTAGSQYTVPTAIYTGGRGGSNSPIVINNRLVLNGSQVSGRCVQSVTGPYRFGDRSFVFAIDCNGYINSMSLADYNLNVVTQSTTVSQILNATVDSNGYVVLNVIGTAGSNYWVSTAIYADSTDNQRPQ